MESHITPTRHTTVNHKEDSEEKDSEVEALVEVEDLEDKAVVEEIGVDIGNPTTIMASKANPQTQHRIEGKEASTTTPTLTNV